MMLALVDGESKKRPPRQKGERATCRCGAQLVAVVPEDYAPHWRHKGGDCDPWSEPEGPWHLAWKERFAEDCREVELVDEGTGEWHRADVRCTRPGAKGVVLELQHSPISAEEQASRDAFYGRDHRMFWLLHIHDEQGSFRASSMRMSLVFGDVVTCHGKAFHRMTWFGFSTRFIERWKRSKAHVFLELDGRVYYLATHAACADLVAILKKGQFALHELTPQQLVAAVQGDET